MNFARDASALGYRRQLDHPFGQVNIIQYDQQVSTRDGQKFLLPLVERRLAHTLCAHDHMDAPIFENRHVEAGQSVAMRVAQWFKGHMIVSRTKDLLEGLLAASGW